MLSRRITSTVLEKCRELFEASPIGELMLARQEVSPELKSELEQIRSKMTSLLRQAERLEGAQEKTLVLEQEEIRELIGRIEVIAENTSRGIKAGPRLEPADFPNSSWLNPDRRSKEPTSTPSTKISRRVQPNSSLRRTSISSPYSILIEREVGSSERRRTVPGMANPAACRVAERLLREGLAYEKIASKLSVSVGAVKALAKQVEDDFKKEMRRSSRAKSSRLAKSSKREKKLAASPDFNEIQGKSAYKEIQLPNKIEAQLVSALKQQESAVEAVASITLGRARPAAESKNEEPSVAHKASSPFTRQQLLL